MPTATVETRRKATISLEADCTASRLCGEFAGSLHDQLSNGNYQWPMSCLDLDRGFEEWQLSLRTARKRAVRASVNGYTFAPFDRTQFMHDIDAINGSLGERQGRPMSDGYRQPVAYSRLPYTCERHRINCYGVFDPSLALVAYTFVYRAGMLALVSQILGHGEHLERLPMFLLMRETVRAEMGSGGMMVYNRHDSGTVGLRQFKEWFRFEPTEVAWQQ